MKVFFMCTHPAMGTGYGRVANKITNYLAGIPGVEVVYYAFQNIERYKIRDRFIDPRIKFYDALEIDPKTPGGFGFNGIAPSIAKESPDVLFIYGSIQITNIIMKSIPLEHIPHKKIFYADIVYEWQNISHYKTLKTFNFDHIWTFTKNWKTHLINDLGFDQKMVDVLPHGIDFDTFLDIPQNEAKVKMGLEPDDFLILNMNRNSTRKNWVTTISAFLQLLKRVDTDQKLKLFCGCKINEKDGGCDIPKLVETECFRLGLNIEQVFGNNLIFCREPQGLKEEEINIIYNAADVGVNTSHGEGFGLITLEHLYFNRPQIVSGVPVSKELFDKHANIIEPKVSTLKVDDFMGISHHCDPSDFTDALEHYYINRGDRPNAREDIKERYSWENVYKVLDKYFRKEE